jgi:homoserine trans-succinylase
MQRLDVLPTETTLTNENCRLMLEAKAAAPVMRPLVSSLVMSPKLHEKGKEGLAAWG